MNAADTIDARHKLRHIAKPSLLIIVISSNEQFDLRTSPYAGLIAVVDKPCSSVPTNALGTSSLDRPSI
jgi:hypothetical protein